MSSLATLMVFYMLSCPLTCIMTFFTILTWLNEFFFTLFTIFLVTIVTFLMETHCMYGFLSYCFNGIILIFGCIFHVPVSTFLMESCFRSVFYLLASWTLFWHHCLLWQGSGCELTWCLWLISCRLHILCDVCICLLPQTCRGHICSILLVMDLKKSLENHA